MNGSIDTTWNHAGSGPNGAIHKILPEEDGSMYIVGTFTTYNGVPRERIAKINANGTLDISWIPNITSNGTITSIAKLPNNKFLI